MLKYVTFCVKKLDKISFHFNYPHREHSVGHKMLITADIYQSEAHLNP